MFLVLDMFLFLQSLFGTPSPAKNLQNDATTTFQFLTKSGKIVCLGVAPEHASCCKVDNGIVTEITMVSKLVVTFTSSSANYPFTAPRKQVHILPRIDFPHGRLAVHLQVCAKPVKPANRCYCHVIGRCNNGYLWGIEGTP